MMFAATRAVFKSTVKKSTGIVGLDVVPNAREVLVGLYEKTLKDVQIMPAEVPYRQAVESFTKYRMQVVRENEDLRVIEDEIGAGQVEELIEQAKDELELIPQYAEWREWEQPKASPLVDDYADLLELDEFKRYGLDDASKARDEAS